MSSRVDPWEQLPNETPADFELFMVYLNMERSERSLARAWREKMGREEGVKPPGSYYEMTQQWQWRDRVLAYDRGQDRKIMRKLEAKRMPSLLATVELGQTLRDRAAAALRMLSPIQQVIGERDGREVILVSVNMTPGEIAKLAQVGMELEQLALGNATARTELMGSADNPLGISVENAKDEFLKRIADVKRRREMAQSAADDEHAMEEPNAAIER